MVVALTLAATLVVAPRSLRAEEPAKQSPASKPPWQRLLQGDDARKAAELDKRLEALQETRKWEEALKVAQELEQLWRRLQGADHYQAVTARWQVEAIRRLLRKEEVVRRDYAATIALQRQAEALWGKGLYRQAQPLVEKVLQVRRAALGEDHPDTAESYGWVAVILDELGRYREAEEGKRKALDIRRQALGEEHPLTAESYNNLAFNLTTQGRYREAGEGYRKALDINRKVLGEDHANTAANYDNLAYNLKVQGRYKEAEEGHRKALDIYRKVLGEDHPDTAQCYNNLGHNLVLQSRFREAEEGFRKALDICRQAWGEEHPLTATSYNNVAYILNAQGRYQEAEEGLRKALDIRRRTRGEQHPETAISYNNVAMNLQAQGRYREAEEGYQKALDIWRQALGEQHPDTARGFNSLAANFNAQSRSREAGEGYQKALDIRRKALGEDHPDTARSYNNLALNLQAQGQYRETEEGLRKAQDTFRKALGEDHSDTAQSYNNLAANLAAQGRYAQAERLWTRAAGSFVAARLRLAASGLERATKTGEQSPLPALAAVLGRNGKPAEAWQRYEESLGRGTWDDLSARLRRPLAEQGQQAELVARLDRLEQLLQNSLAVKDPTPEQQRQREDLLTRHLRAQKELQRFGAQLEEKYGPAAGQVFDISRIQVALPADAALLGWIDIKPAGPKAADPDGEHRAFLLRHSGAPVCVRLRGSGSGGAWTEEDTTLPVRLRAALQSPRGDWKPLAQLLRQQRLGPLDKYLTAHDDLPAVCRLLVLPSPALAGVPAEVFAEGYTVSYALSGTLFAHLHQQPKPTGQGLLALADPVFQAPTVVEKPLPLPPGGVLLSMVVPGGNAAQAGLKPNDVLLRYAATELKGPADLPPLLQAKSDGKPVPVTAWRQGKQLDTQVQPGKLGVVLADKPAPETLLEQRRLDKWLASRGDDSWPDLPGTRLEAEALRRLLAGQGETRLLTDSQASEQRLDELAKGGALGQYRFVHLATHGEVDDAWPLRSAVILARDQLPDALQQLRAGLPAYDGRLTAQEILQHWRLQAELVSLSACQTALGKYERGEGFVGFAQALLLAGSRSVCLSLWKVDDTATALLMQRIYANLLGKRQGLKAPLGKAEALAEAKHWLQQLSAEEAVRLAAALGEGVARGKGRPALPQRDQPAADKDARPYAHPYYWAAFVLIGDPQ
jgi:tetratricopeptide (TPR) repeat protein